MLVCGYWARACVCVRYASGVHACVCVHVHLAAYFPEQPTETTLERKHQQAQGHPHGNRLPAEHHVRRQRPPATPPHQIINTVGNIKTAHVLLKCIKETII